MIRLGADRDWPPFEYLQADGQLGGLAALYLQILEDKFGIDFTHMALQWTRTRPFPTIPIFGATTTEQLAHILKAPSVELPEELLAEVSKAHRAHPMPY